MQNMLFGVVIVKQGSLRTTIKRRKISCNRLNSPGTTHTLAGNTDIVTRIF